MRCPECGSETLDPAESCAQCGALAPVGDDDQYPAGTVRLKLVGVRVEMPSNNPIALLKEADGDRYLPIWIGAVEATAIAFAQRGMVSLRPLTHDLFCDVLRTAGIQLLNVTISALVDGIFEACLSLADKKTVSCRPSDAIALAIRMGTPILVSVEVLDQAGVEVPDEAR